MEGFHNMETTLLWSVIHTYFKSLLIGFSIAAPVGPIGILCIRRTLHEGSKAGFISGLGAATADAIYGSIAAFGLTFISSLLISQQNWIRLVGGLFLCYLGIKSFFSPVAEQPAAVQGGRGLLGAYASTFFFTFTNPITILVFGTIFATLNPMSGAGYLPAVALVLGVFSGSGLWWLTLSSGVNLLRSRFTPNSLRWVNRISGAFITAFGAAALLR
jgi:threonine/homoserine/homoserine lactone efflux protein